MVEDRLKELRTTIRKSGKGVVEELIKRNRDFCSFCSQTDNLTKEHVIPKWVFQNDPIKGFKTTVNETYQTYSKTVVPACERCNSYILGSLEKHIKSICQKFKDETDSLSSDDLEKLVLWLELIGYKYQFLDLVRVFKKRKGEQFIPYLSNIPLGIMQDLNLSSSKVFSKIRKAQRVLTVKSKLNRLNSLIVFKTSNDSFHFMNSRSEFIFLEMPEYSIALFYFFEKSFSSESDGHKDAQEILRRVYQ